MSKRQTYAAHERSMRVLKTRTLNTLAFFTLFTRVGLIFKPWS